MINIDKKQTDIIDIPYAELNKKGLTLRAVMAMFFSGDQHKIAIPIPLIDFLEDYNSAIVLNHLLESTLSCKIQGGWICKTYDDFYSEVRLKETAVRRVKYILEEKGLIQAKVKLVGGGAKLHYRINNDNFIKSFTQYIKSVSSQLNLY